MISRHFAVSITDITRDNLYIVREAMDRARWRYAFGDDHKGHPLAEHLLWHLGPDTLRLACRKGHAPRDILSTGIYSRLIVLTVDLCGFSSYVHQSNNETVVRQMTTAFYSKARYEIHDAGGFMYQFVGDQVIGVFGFPDVYPDPAIRALACAQAMIEIGESVSQSWSRQVKKTPSSGGAHVALTIGDLNLISLRPFSRRYIGFAGDAINVAARLLDRAGRGEIVISDDLYRNLDPALRESFESQAPVMAKNIGAIPCWLWPAGAALGFAVAADAAVRSSS